MNADAFILASARVKGLSVMTGDEVLGKVRGLCNEKGLRCAVNWG